LTPLADNPNQRAIIGDWSIADVDQRNSLPVDIDHTMIIRTVSMSAAWLGQAGPGDHTVDVPAQTLRAQSAV
jgi:hypothetical protein